MPYRWTYLRRVNQQPGPSVSGHWPISLFRAALSAAEETIQGGPFASAWLQLFQAHLSNLEPRMLRWRGNLGTSGEMRRAYSGLYGRYFARALLAGELGVTDFVSLKTDSTQINGGVTVSRVRKGDIPDWIAWDPQRLGYVLGEAKGRLSGSPQSYLTGRPSCINAGKAQFGRVVVKDARNRRIQTRNWVAANRWSTDQQRVQAVSLLWDPPGDGEPLAREEGRRHADAIRRHRIEAIVRGLGDPGFLVRIVAPGAEVGLPALETNATQERPFRQYDTPSRKPHSGSYQAAIVTSFGIRPIRDQNDLQDAQAIGSTSSIDKPAMIFGIASGTPRIPENGQATWLSENGIASADGSALFTLKRVDIERA